MSTVKIGIIETAGWVALGASPLSRLAGRSLLSHVVEAARRSAEVRRLIVLTDDRETMIAAERLGIAVEPAPQSVDPTLTGLARAADVASTWIADAGRPPAEIVLWLGPGAAILRPEDLDHAVRPSGLDLTLLGFQWDGDVWTAQGNLDRTVPVLDSAALYAIRGARLHESGPDGDGRSACLLIPADRVATIAGRFDFARAERAIEGRGQDDRLRLIPSDPSAVVFDFDGVMTDNKVYVLQDGRETVACSRSDGWGITQLKKTGIPLLVLSTERNPVVRARCDKLGLTCLHGYDEKSIALRAWLDENQVDPARVIYLGNDTNDLPSMALVGCPVAVGDAYPEVIAACRFVLKANGGEGAVRELADLVIRARTS